MSSYWKPRAQLGREQCQWMTPCLAKSKMSNNHTYRSETPNGIVHTKLMLEFLSPSKREMPRGLAIVFEPETKMLHRWTPWANKWRNSLFWPHISDRTNNPTHQNHSHSSSIWERESRNNLQQQAMEITAMASATPRPALPTPSSSTSPPHTVNAFSKPQLKRSRISLPTSTTISLLALFAPPHEAKAALSISKDQIVSSLTEVGNSFCISKIGKNKRKKKNLYHIIKVVDFQLVSSTSCIAQ